MAELLSNEDIGTALEGVDDWRRDGDAIARDLKFDDFAAAMAFVNGVAAAAEEMNHHPDILVHGWNRVRLTITNHSAGGLTPPDFALAAEVDALAGSANG
jgi:4a-hydroxytetrahydrobiopterin dehydratase